VDPRPPEVAEGVGAEEVEEAEGEPLVRELSVFSSVPADALPAPVRVARSPRVNLISASTKMEMKDLPDTETDGETCCKQQQNSTKDPPELLPALSFSVVGPSRRLFTHGGSSSRSSSGGDVSNSIVFFGYSSIVIGIVPSSRLVL
jgi:hypothetical protein